MKKWAGLIGLAAVALLAWGNWAGWVEPAVTQPIQFPHKTHLELKLACTTCHQRAEKDAVAGRPPTILCVACHSGREARSEEAKKLQALGQKGGEIPWKRVWRLPSHVFFSHRTHVAVAKVKCQTCHGPMETLTQPPPRALKRLTMNDCIGCHQQWEWPKGGEPQAGREIKDTNENGRELAKVTARQVSTDCNACHR
jgi:predicted CXXCH cytochrome family protein